MITPAYDKLVAVSPNPSIEKTSINPSLKLSASRDHDALLSLPVCDGLALVRAFNALGGVASMCLLISDEHDQWILDALHREAIKVSAHTLRRKIASHEPFDLADRQTSYVKTTGSMRIDNTAWQSFLQVLFEVIDEHSLVTIHGSLPNGAPVDGYQQIIAAANSKSAPVVLDVDTANILTPLLIKPWGMCLNLTDEWQKSDKHITIQDTIHRLASSHLDGGCEWMLVNTVDDGVYLLTRESSWRAIITTKILAVDLTGDNEVMLAGFLYSLMRREDFSFSLGFAKAAAYANAIQPGAGVFSTDDVIRFHSDVFVQQVV